MRWLLILLLTCPMWAAACAPTQGTAFAESFNGTDLCGFNNQSGCVQTWTALQGTSMSIAVSPAANPFSCPNALELAQNATQAQVATYGTFNDIPGATSADIFIEFYITATPGSFANLMSVFRSQLGTNSPMGAVTTTTPGVECFSGGNFSATMAASLNAWHLLQCHIDSTAANCYGKLDAGSNQTFTCANTGDFNQIRLYGQTAASSNTYFGDVYINSTNGGGSHPSMLFDQAGVTTGTVPTVANLTSATHCGNGVWTLSTTPLTTFTFSNTNSISYPVPQTACGQIYAGNSGLSVAETLSSTTEFIKYGFLSYYAESTVGFYYLTTSASGTASKQDQAELISGDGTNWIIMYTQSTGAQLQMCLEQSSTGTGVGCANISPSTWYWVTMELNQNATLVLRIYNGTTFAQIGTLYGVGNTGGNVPAAFVFGSALGAITGTQNGTAYISNIILDYANSIFALLPAGVSNDTLDPKATLRPGSMYP